MKLKYVAIMMTAIALTACGSSNDNNKEVNMKIEQKEVSMKLGDVAFSTLLNPNDGQVKTVKDTLVINANGKTDFFCDPLGEATNLTSPQLLIDIDNTKPFTLSVKVTPEFKADDMYSAAGIVLYEGPTSWQKLCYEQDEQGDHRIVTVRTVGDSDDNNHQIVNTKDVWLRLCSDGKRVGNYWSEDGKKWHLVRIYKNIYPDKFHIALTSQCPKGDGFVSKFTDLTLTQTFMKNMRGE